MHSRNLKLITIFSRNNNAGNVGFSSGLKGHSTMVTPNRRYTPISGTPGSGAGRGGGAGGSIKESGGALGKYGAANEEGYFYQKHRELLGKLKEKLKKEPPKEKPEPKPEE